MLWFKRHPDLTYFLSIMCLGIIWTLCGLIYQAVHLSWLFYIVLLTIPAFLIITVWVTKQKGRSLWNVLWLGFGWIIGALVILLLEDRGKERGFFTKADGPTSGYFTCKCCGASYNVKWGKFYGASHRCCTGLPQDEQEELWDNRLNPTSVLLRDCPHW